MFLGKSASLTDECDGENPNPFSNTFISDGDEVFLCKLKTIRNKVPLNTANYKFTAGTHMSQEFSKVTSPLSQVLIQI